MAGYSITIPGVTFDGVTNLIEAGSLTVDAKVGKRSTASFTALIGDGMTHLQQDQQVSIYDASSVLAFSGYITQPQETPRSTGNPLEVQVTCADQHRLADKRRVAAVYTNRTVGTIVQSLVNTILTQEGVTIGQIFDGTEPSATLYPSTTLYPSGGSGLIPLATFTYCTVAQALDQLVTAASVSGVPYYWQIDQNKALFFVPYTTITGPSVDGTQIEIANNPPTVTRQNTAYRNTQYIVGGTAQTLTQNEKHLGDGNATAWAMGYEVASTPQVFVDDVPQSVAIKGGNVSASFYWAQGSVTITQDSGGTKLTSANTLKVIYVGQYPTVIIDQDASQVAYDAALDGTSGIVEDVVQDQTITSIANGLVEASQLLTYYGQQGIQLKFDTLQTGFAPGQLSPITLPDFGFNAEQMLVTEVSASDQQDGINIWYTVTALEGPYDVTWVDFFSKLLAQSSPANSINAGVSQSLALLASFTGSLTLTASFTATVYSCPIPNTTLFPSTSLHPC